MVLIYSVSKGKRWIKNDGAVFIDQMLGWFLDIAIKVGFKSVFLEKLEYVWFSRKSGFQALAEC